MDAKTTRSGSGKVSSAQGGRRTVAPPPVDPADLEADEDLGLDDDAADGGALSFGGDREGVEKPDSESEEQEFERARSARCPEKSLDATQLYLNEIGYSPLLSADEEKHYARLARSGDEAG